MGSVRKQFPAGIHVPSLTWFDGTPSQEIDWAVQTKHFEFLVKSGLHGSTDWSFSAYIFAGSLANILTYNEVVIAGTNGEAVTLTAEEKRKLVQTVRQVAVSSGRPEIPITVGCGGQCTRDVIAETRLAADAGADYALVLTPSYFHFAMNEDAIVGFFRELADASPVPVIIYNFPGVVAGLDVNSDMLAAMGSHPNIIGVKLTCGGIAKVARVTAQYDPSEFFTLAGQSDWLVPALAMGSIGTITGVANLYPQYCVKIFDLYQAGKVKEAEEVQIKLAKMEWGFGKGGINGTKYIVAKLRGYPLESSHCRRPYPQFADPKKQAWIDGVVRPLEVDEKAINEQY